MELDNILGSSLFNFTRNDISGFDHPCIQLQLLLFFGLPSSFYVNK